MYRIASKPSPTVGSMKSRGPLPPRESHRPSGRNAPPEQNALVLYDKPTAVLVAGSYSAE